MQKFTCCLIVFATAAYAQSVIGIHPPSSIPKPDISNSTAGGIQADRPLLGYLVDSSNIVYSVVGSANSPRWGEPLTLPSSADAAFLPPLQQYALLSSAAGLCVAKLSRSSFSTQTVIPHALAHPDKVVFSPTGKTVALFSSAESRIQLLAYSGGSAEVILTIPLPNASNLQRLAISDDGEFLVAALSGQPALISKNGKEWQRLAISYLADAWTFLPNTHTLAISDLAAKVVVILPEAGQAGSAQRIFPTGQMQANLLAPNKDGTELLALDLGAGSSWSIDLAAETVTPLPDKGAINALSVLRDGQTFLISIRQSPGLVRLASNIVTPSR